MQQRLLSKRKLEIAEYYYKAEVKPANLCEPSEPKPFSLLRELELNDCGDLRLVGSTAAQISSFSKFNYIEKEATISKLHIPCVILRSHRKSCSTGTADENRNMVSLALTFILHSFNQKLEMVAQ